MLRLQGRVAARLILYSGINKNGVRGCATSYTRFEIDGLVPVFLSFHYSEMHKKVTQRVGWVENPTSPQAV